MKISLVRKPATVVPVMFCTNTYKNEIGLGPPPRLENIDLG